MSSKKRRLRNYLLKPLLQMKFGLYAVLLGLVFTVLYTYMVYAGIEHIFKILLEISDVQDEVVELLRTSLTNLSLWLVLVGALYFLLLIVISVVFTHRLIGPEVAFRRHIRALSEGLYNSRVTLRKTDAFQELAHELNRLAEVLERKGQ